MALRAPGAVIVVGGDAGADVDVFDDGALSVSWPASEERASYESDRFVCFVEGALYDPAGPNRAESLAAAYARQGERAFGRARGEYWALVWEREPRRGVLVTDHLGSRAPYWFSDGTMLVAASEVSDLLRVLDSRPAPDALALAHWLMATAAPGGATLFAGVRRLEAAHLLQVGGSVSEPRRYWSPSYRAPLREPRGALPERLRAVLAESVRRRVNADTGVLLSGGLDSSVVAAFAAQQRNRLPAYSATFPEHPTIDESRLIDRTAERLGLDSTRIVVSGGSVLAGAMSYIEAWQLPPASPNLFFWTPLLERAASDGVKVMLDGEGGDELFGFSPYLLADRLRHGRLLSAIGLTRRWSGIGTPSVRRTAQLLATYGLAAALPPGAHTLARRVRGEQRYLTPWLSGQLGRAWLESEESAFAWKRLPGPRWWAHVVGAVTRGAGPALVYEQSRRRAALAGIDARHPLVDVDVVELALQLPPELGFDHRYSRPLLRDAVAGMLPDEVRLRPDKSWFDALFHGLLAGPELPVARELLTASDAELAAYIDIGAVHRVLLADEPPEKYPWRMIWAMRLWRLLTAELWLRHERDPGFADALRKRLAPVEAAHAIVRSR